MPDLNIGTMLADAEADNEKLLDRVQELEAQRIAWIKECHEVEQTLGKALGYPFYCDLDSFPDATDADGVCVGEHIPATLAMEAAARILKLEEKINTFRELLTHSASRVAELKEQREKLEEENARLMEACDIFEANSAGATQLWEACLAAKQRIHFVGMPNEPKTEDGKPDWRGVIEKVEAALAIDPQGAKTP